MKWIQTYTKKKFFPLQPNEDLICIEDIAHSLANQCRFNGHTKKFYSVAEHSLLMVRLYFLTRKELAKYALLHDASEAYLTDIPRPLKYLPEFDFYRQAEHRLQSLIYLKFGLDPCVPPEIAEADYFILGEEAEWLMSPIHPEWKINGTSLLNAPNFFPMLPELAEMQYLETYNQLFG